MEKIFNTAYPESCESFVQRLVTLTTASFSEL